MVIFMIAMYVLGVFLRNCLGVMKEGLTLEFGLTTESYGVIGGAFMYSYTLMQIPAGFLVDWIGARKSNISGGLILTIGTIIFATAKTAFILSIGRFLSGIGAGLLFISLTKIISMWFAAKDFSLLIAIINGAGFIGGLLAQGPLAAIMGDISWKSIFMVLGFLCVVIWLGCFRYAYETPVIVGFDPVAGADMEPEDKSNSHSFKDAWEGLKHVLKCKRTWLGCTAAIGVSGAYNAITGVWGAAYMESIYHVDAITATTPNMAIFLGLLAGSFIVTPISNKIGKRLIPMRICAIIVVIIWAVIAINISGFIPYNLIIVIFFIQGLFTSWTIMMTTIGKESHLSKYTGVATSVYNCGSFIGASIFSPIMGFIIGHYNDSTFGYSMAMGFCALVCAILFINLLLIPETHCKNCGEEFEKLYPVK